MSLTAQEIFDRVVARLRDGTGVAFEGGRCRYLTADGRKCAVGIFIPDGDRAQDYDRGVGSLLVEFAHCAWAKQLKPHEDLLFRLQRVHDDPRNWNGVDLSKVGQRALSSIAESFRLTPQEA